MKLTDKSRCKMRARVVWVSDNVRGYLRLAPIDGEIYDESVWVRKRAATSDLKVGDEVDLAITIRRRPDGTVDGLRPWVRRVYVK